MFKANENYAKLPGSYLFSTIGKKVKEYSKAHPDAKLIRLGIGDVTLPLAPSVIAAMHSAVDEMGKAETFRGYAPDLGYEFLRKAIIDGDYKAWGVDLDIDEIFISDGAKSDSGNIGDIFFSIDENNPQKISFTGKDGNFNVTIDGEDIFSEVDFYRYERPNYIKDGYATTFIPMTRTITVINGEEFSESYRIEEIYNKNASNIIEDASNIYVDYTKSDEDELYRSDIDQNEEIRTFIKPIPARKGLLESIYHGEKVDLESGSYEYSRKPEKCKTYKRLKRIANIYIL